MIGHKQDLILWLNFSNTLADKIELDLDLDYRSFWDLYIYKKAKKHSKHEL